MQVIIILLLMYAQSNGGFGFRNFTHTDPLLRPTYKTISIQSTSSNLQFFPRLVYASDSDEVLPLTTGDTAATPRYRKPNLGIYLAEGGASFLVGNVISYYSILLIYTGFGTREYTSHWGLIHFISPLYSFTYPFASALVIDITGRIFKCPGSFWGAVGGGLLGIGVGWCSLYAIDQQGWGSTISWSLLVGLPPIFSTTGYNLFRKRESSQSNLFLHENYMVAQSYSSRTMANMPQPELQIKVQVIEIKF